MGGTAAAHGGSTAQQPLHPRAAAGLTALLLLAGLLLRMFFLRRHAFLAGDSYLYQDIAQNWLHEHLYGLSTDAAPRPTLIRVPGYPAILAALAWCFDRVLPADPGTLRSFLPVLWLQVFVDLLTCVLVAAIVRRMVGQRAALVALALGCLCPFTANYTAVPLTETFTLLFLVLTYVALQGWLEAPSRRWLLLLAGALSCGTLLRPDQGLVAVVTLPALALHNAANLRSRLRAPILCAGLAILPFVPWTVRNYRTFHVFQPLASRLAIDPGEVAPRGFQAWYRTWAVDFASTEDAYWKYPEETVATADMPNRAFDSAGERATVAQLFTRTAATHQLDPAVEAQFATLAQQRTRAHPVRTRLLLPLARLADMLLHPRTEMLPVAERWWQYRQHPAQTVFAFVYGLWNGVYLVAGLLGAARLLTWDRLPRQGRIVIVSMVAYIAARCLLLMTLDNAEQRYTLEFLPLMMVFAGGLWPRREAAKA